MCNQYKKRSDSIANIYTLFFLSFHFHCFVAKRSSFSSICTIKKKYEQIYFVFILYGGKMRRRRRNYQTINELYECFVHKDVKDL